MPKTVNHQRVAIRRGNAPDDTYSAGQVVLVFVQVYGFRWYL